MEVFALLAVGVVLLLPVVAIVVASVALSKANRALSRLAAMGVDVAPVVGVPAAPPVQAPPPVKPPARAPETVPAPAPTAAPPTPAETAPTPAAPMTAGEPAPSARQAPAVPTAASAAPPPASLEERIGVTWFTRIGAGVLLLGAAYFFKYAVDNQWIGPWARVAIGVACGIAVLVFAERIKAKARPAYVDAVRGVGLMFLYVSAYAAYGFYRLVPLGVAFLALAVVALLGGALALAARSQVVLILSLLAALANPVLLSTGEDRPVALFAYLALVTSAAMWAALRLEAVAAAWLAMAGTGVLAAGWHGEFFRVVPPALHPVTGEAVPGSAGAYWTLAARGAPLAFLAVFSAQWIALAGAAVRRAWERVAPTAVLLAGLLLLEVGCAALLPDRPALLAAAMVACAVVSLALLRGAQTPLATLPLLAAFLALAAQTGAAKDEPLELLALALVALAVYGGVFLARSRHLEASVSVATLRLFTVAVAMAVVFAAMLLLPLHPGALAAVALAAGATAALVGGLRERPEVAAGAGAVAALALLVAAPVGATRTDPWFLPLAAAWGAVYLGFGAYHLLLRRAETSPLAVATTCGGPLGFVAVVLLATPAGARGLRALCVGAAAVALFALGAELLRRRREERDGATILLGLGLALLALAVGLAFSGVTITLVWALMGAAVVAAAVRAGDERWLAGGVAMLGLAVFRLLAIDAAVPVREAALFAASGGASGAPYPAPLLNPRALAVVGVAAALLFAAWRSAEGWRQTAAGLAIVGYTALLALAIVEVRTLVTAYPPLPVPGLPVDELQVWLGQLREAVALQAGRRAVSATLVMGGFGAALLTGGFALRSVFHRWLGLSVLGATVAKLALWDIWQLPRLSRVLVLVGVGALLLGAGFLYARFGNRLLGLLRGGAAVVAALLLVPAAFAVEAARFADRATVEVAAPGYVVITVPPELYRRSLRGPGLGDLRIVGPDGLEAPWVLRDVAAEVPPAVRPAELLDPVALPDGAARATFDLGEAGVRHSEVTLRLGGENFLRECAVEVSDDRREWAAIATGRVFRATVGGATAEHLTLAYPTSAARYVRVTVEGVPGEGPVTVAGGDVRLRVAAAPEPAAAVPLAAVRSERSLDGRTSILIFDAGAAGVPLSAVLVESPAERFLRQVTVEAASSEATWTRVGEGVLYRAGDRAEAVRISAATTKRYLRLLIRDGDDRPLPVAGLRGEYRLQEIVFATSRPGAHTLYLGAKGVRTPVYDIGKLLARAPETPTTRAALAPLEANPAFHPVKPAAPLWTERFRVPIAVTLALVLVGLALWAVRLLRVSREAGGE